MFEMSICRPYNIIYDMKTVVNKVSVNIIVTYIFTLFWLGNGRQKPYIRSQLRVGLESLNITIVSYFLACILDHALIFWLF